MVVADLGRTLLDFISSSDTYTLLKVLLLQTQLDFGHLGNRRMFLISVRRIISQRPGKCCVTIGMEKECKIFSTLQQPDAASVHGTCVSNGIIR